jgi:glycosyltransferase involved in cell wall biosynthesis
LLAVDDQPDANYRSHVRSLVDRLGIGPRVRWIDALDHASMPDFYRLGDVTVSVARSDGVSNAVLESMASRTPVVLGDIPNYEGIFADGEHCRMANPTDPRSIADAIVDVLTNTSQRTRIIETAYARVAEYADFASHTARLESQLRELVDSRSRPWRLGLRARHALNLPLLLLERDDAR